MPQHPSKTWADEERHFLQKCVVEYGCCREILHDLMGRKYGAKYAQEGRGPYTAQRIWDEYTQRKNVGNPIALNRYIYQASGATAYSSNDVTLRSRLDADIHALAAQATGKNSMSGKDQHHIVLGGGQVAAHYADGPLVPGTALPPQASSPSQTTTAAGANTIHIMGQSAAANPSAVGSSMPAPSAALTHGGMPTDGSGSAIRSAKAKVVQKQILSRPKKQLPMIHRDALRMQNGDIFPGARRSQFSEDYVQMDTALYAYGGQVVRFTRLANTYDAMLCDLAICDECEGGRAEPPVDSPYDYSKRSPADYGMPFVHTRRDAKRMLGQATVFIDVAAKDLVELAMPESVDTDVMMFNVDGRQQLADVKICGPRDCPACLAAAVANEQEEESET
ncbi:hypothetical protein Slin15195_G115040 [Septoria linicola]|uniref:Uncharacterized protein n=1 Tax=Septoria linicola TaxID=215465 RepID=A0A9Q9EPK2_9PEZI|nr:hypothetical protein Slin15195_G115040 [Septoria linicola]